MSFPQGSSGFPPGLGFSQVNAEAPPLDEALRYECLPCGTSYAQSQGYWLHVRTVHHPKSCLFCTTFKWARPYEYRIHLQKKHPDVDPDVILGKPAGSRRRATILTELPQQPPISPPAAEQDQRFGADFRPNPPAPPSPAPAGYTSVFPPAVPFADYSSSSQPVYAGKTVTVDRQGYAHGPEFLGSTYPLSIFPSTLGYAGPINDNSHQDPGQFGLPSAHSSGSTATYSPDMAPMHYSPLSDADIDATFNSIFANTL